MDATALGIDIKNKRISIKEVIDQCAENISLKEGYINALISPMIDDAYERAAELQMHVDETKSALFGIPFVAKDNICMAQKRTTCASNMLRDYVSPYTATALQKVIDSGSICIGKSNMDEFAMGATGETSYFGKTLNPLDYGRVPGGSSSGAAVAVASGECLFALGSDTGGSIRLPASYCGLVGMLPTYGRVSRYGLVAHASSLDQIGPITRSVRDCANVLNLICGYDCNDATSVNVETKKFDILKSVNGMKVAISEEFMKIADERMCKMVGNAAKKLEEAGAVVEDADLSFLKDASEVYSIISCAEASSNLAKYDGIKYGGFADLAGDTDFVCKETRRIGFGDEVKRRILFGSYVLSDGYEKFFLPAQAMRRNISDRLKELLENYDCILLPVSKTTAPAFDASFSSAKEINATDIFTVPANLAHLPAISVPFGEEDGIPAGVQLIGRAFDENTILTLAKVLERH